MALSEIFQATYNVPSRILNRVGETGDRWMEGVTDVLKGAKNLCKWAVDSGERVLVKPGKELVYGALEGVRDLPATVKGLTVDTSVQIVKGVGGIITETAKEIGEVLKDFKPKAIATFDGLIKAISDTLALPTTTLVKTLWKQIAEEAIGGAYLKGKDALEKGTGKDLMRAIGSVRLAVEGVFETVKKTFTEDVWNVLTPVAVGVGRIPVGIFGDINFEVSDNGSVHRRASKCPSAPAMVHHAAPPPATHNGNGGHAKKKGTLSEAEKEEIKKNHNELKERMKIREEEDHGHH